jgi:serine/threonine-protein kinase
VLLAAVVATALISRVAVRGTLQVARLTVAVPPAEPPAIGLGPVAAISPDGRELVYVARRGGSTQLYRRPFDRYDTRPIAGTEGGYYPFFSRDGQWLGFFADHKLKKVALSGEPPLNLCDVPVSVGAVWGDDGTIFFTPSPNSGISKVAAAGGTPQLVTTPDRDRGEMGHYWPDILPDGKSLVFTIAESSGKFRVAVQSLETGKRQLLIENANSARYAPTGHLVFARGGVLMAVPFDAAAQRVRGQEAVLVDSVVNTNTGGAQYSLSDEGSLVYVSGRVGAAKSSLVWVDREGRARAIPAPPRAYMDPRISPDRKRLMLTIMEPASSNVWIYDVARGTLARLTYEGFENETSVWAPDGVTVIISSSRAGSPSNVILRRAADGGSGEERLWGGTQHAHLGSLSPDGRTLLFTGYDTIEGGNIFALPLVAGAQPQVRIKTQFHEWGPAFSPDGHWFAYVSNESGRDEVYVQAFPGPGPKIPVSTDGGTEPVWARRGKELFYRHGDRIVVVPVSTGVSVSLGNSRALFEDVFERGLPLGHVNYDATPDGQEFLMVKPGEQPTSAVDINVVLHWFEDVKRTAPRAR